MSAAEARTSCRPRRLRRAGARDFVLLSIAALILLLAGVYYYAYGSASDHLPASVEDAVPFVCDKCGTKFSLSANAAAAELSGAAANPRENTGRGGGHIRCTACGEPAARRDLSGQS